MRILNALVIAFSTYSKIPMPHAEWNEQNKAHSLCFFPLIGLVIALLLGGALWVCDFFKLGQLFRGVMGTVIPLLVTGGIHMDGFMDTCDAMASWQTIERRLEILKDPHSGAFAVMGCGLYLLLMCAVISELHFALWASVGMCFVVSRALSALTLTHFRKAKASGMLAGFAKAAVPKAVTISSVLYCLLAIAVWVWQLGIAVLFPILTAFVCILAYRRKAYRYFGGVSGDLAGWFTQVIELSSIAAIVLGMRLL